MQSNSHVDNVKPSLFKHTHSKIIVIGLIVVASSFGIFYFSVSYYLPIFELSSEFRVSSERLPLTITKDLEENTQVGIIAKSRISQDVLLNAKIKDPSGEIVYDFNFREKLLTTFTPTVTGVHTLIVIPVEQERDTIQAALGDPKAIEQFDNDERMSYVWALFAIYGYVGILTAIGLVVIFVGSIMAVKLGIKTRKIFLPSIVFSIFFLVATVGFFNYLFFFPFQTMSLIFEVPKILFAPENFDSETFLDKLVSPTSSYSKSSDPPDKLKAIEIGGNVGSLAVNDNTNMIYVVNSFGTDKNTEIAVIDGSSNQIIDKIQIDTILTRPILTFNPSSNLLVVVDNYGDSRESQSKIHIVDLSTRQEISTFNFETNSSPITFVENSKLAYVNHVDDSSLSVIDIEKNSIIKKISVGQNPSGLTFNPSTNRVYSSSFISHAIKVIDVSSHEVIETIRFEFGPGNMEVNPNTNLIYVANGGHYTKKGTIISVLDGSSHTVLETIDLGDWPNLIELNPITNLLYVQKYNENTIAVIDTNTNKVIGNIELEFRPMYMDINLITNQVYLSGYNNKLIAIIDGNTNELREFDNPDKVI